MCEGATIYDAGKLHFHSARYLLISANSLTPCDVEVVQTAPAASRWITNFVISPGIYRTIEQG
jgi:hypothetical protein